jgi:hypothetical protein
MILILLLIFPLGAFSRKDHEQEQDHEQEGYPRGNAVSHSSNSAGFAFRKMSQTPAKISAPPANDQSVKVSPPRSQPKATAPGGVMNEIVCRFVTDILGISQ